MSNAIARVLVVDDSATSRAMLYKQVSQCGCQVDCAENGHAALAAMAANRYDLVLLDCYMPDLNGYEVARAVRVLEQKDGGDRYTPIIGISAEADATHVRLCLDSGMDNTLGKPLPLAEFKMLLTLWCDYEWGDAQGAAPVATAVTIPTTQVDLQALFLSTTMHDLAQMREAYARGDIEGGKRMAHRMKGAALTMRRESIVELLERIEEASNRLDRTSLVVIVAAMDALQAHMGA